MCLQPSRCGSFIGSLRRFGDLRRHREIALWGSVSHGQQALLNVQRNAFMCRPFQLSPCGTVSCVARGAAPLATHDTVDTGRENPTAHFFGITMQPYALGTKQPRGAATRCCPALCLRHTTTVHPRLGLHFQVRDTLGALAARAAAVNLPLSSAQAGPRQSNPSGAGAGSSGTGLLLSRLLPRYSSPLATKSVVMYSPAWVKSQVRHNHL